jgi:hypothetical protein
VGIITIAIRAHGYGFLKINIAPLYDWKDAKEVIGNCASIGGGHFPNVSLKEVA